MYEVTGIQLSSAEDSPETNWGMAGPPPGADLTHWICKFQPMNGDYSTTTTDVI